MVAVGDLVGAEGLEVGSFEFLAQDVAAIDGLERIGDELAFAKKCCGAADGFQRGGAFAVRKQSGVIGEDRAAASAAADTGEVGVSEDLGVIGGQGRVGDQCGDRRVKSS